MFHIIGLIIAIVFAAMIVDLLVPGTVDAIKTYLGI